MDADRILCVYERIAGLMARMVDAARAQEWEQLGRLETSCQTCIGALKTTNLDVPMTVELRERRNRLIGEVLRADAQIRELTDPLEARLRPYFGAQGTSRSRQTAPRTRSRSQPTKTKRTS
jgi:flagellar protein FliT